MTHQVRDQISAFLDDELSADESAFLVRRLERDDNARHTMVRYAMIGAALRGELIHPDPYRLRRRVALRLDGGHSARKTTALAAQPGDRWPLLGFGAAAALGALALVLLRFDTTTLDSPGASDNAVAVTQTAVTSPTAPEYAAVANDVRNASLQSSAPQPIRFTNYLVHHGEFATRVGRPWIYSAVVSSRELERQPQVEGASWRQ